MNTFAVVFLCIQACLVQSAFGQCTSRAAVADAAYAGPYGLSAYDALAYPAAGFAGRALAYDGLNAGCAGRALAYDGLVGPFGYAAPGLAAPFGLAAPGLAAPYGLAAPALAYDGFAYPGAAPYGGAGEGNVAVAGELPVAGSTAVAGQVPIMGAVRFDGAIPAAGAVSITGKCACGCGAPYDYII